MGAAGHGLGDLRQMQGHGGRGAAWQDEGGALGRGGADGAEDIGRAGPLVARGYGPRAATGPAAGDLVFLPDPGLVLEPDLYRLAGSLAGRDLRHSRGKVLWDGPPPPWAPGWPRL